MKGPIRGTLLGGDAKGPKFVLHVQNVCVIRLVPIMVLGCDPEECENGSLQERFQLLGKTNRCEGLIETVKGTSEESGLLTGGNEVPALLQERLQPGRNRLGGSLDHGEGSSPGVPMESLVHLPGLVQVRFRVPEATPVKPTDVGFSS